MADLKVAVNDNSGTADSTGGSAPEQPVATKAYKVKAENGLFKNGETIKAGKTVELDEVTARNFIAAGDIEEIE